MPHVKHNYPHNWKDEIRPRILKRDGYKCVVCGVFNNVRGIREDDGTFIELDELILNYAIVTKKKIIQIHLSVSHEDHDTTNNVDSNLKSRCQYHHLEHDREYHSIMRKAKKNTDILPPFSSLP